jgi:uncharacterized RDD family membrane protein YckC
MGSGATRKQQEHPAADRAAELLRGLDRLKTDEPRLAEPMERATARVIDVLVCLVVFFVVGAAGYVAGNALGLTVEPDASPGGLRTGTPKMHPAVSWATLFAIVLVLWLYEVPATARRGNHFAKRRLKLRVVGPDGQVPGLARASARWFGAWLPAFAAFALWGATVESNWAFLFLGLELGALLIPGWMFFDQENRGLHDRLAGTRVLAQR